MPLTANERSIEDRLIDAIYLLDMNPDNIDHISLKKAYRNKALQYHPDRNGDDHSKTLIFEEINEANRLISDQINAGNYLIPGLQERWQYIVAKKERAFNEAHNGKSTKSRVNPDNQDKLVGLTPKTIPFDHQVVAFNRFKDSEYFALFADMGTGKSKIAIDIGAYKYINGEINTMMIIAPNNVHIQWEREQFPLHCPIPYEAQTWEQAKWANQRYRVKISDFIEEPSDVLKVLLVNVESFQGDTAKMIIKLLMRFNKIFVVLDESTRIKTPTAKRSIRIRELHTATARCILTGTPTAKSPLDIWSPFNFLKKDYFGMDWKTFNARYSVQIMDYSSKRKRTINDYEFDKVKQAIASWQGDGDMMDCLGDVANNLGMSFRDVRFIHEQDQVSRYKDENVLKQIIGDDTFSVRKEDCLDLPEKVFEVIHVNMAEDQKKAYRELGAYMQAMSEDGAPLTVKGILALMTRFRQICGGHFPSKTEEHATTMLFPFKTNPKLVALMEDIEENTVDKQCIVWASFREEIRLIVSTLRQAGYTAETYYGADDKHKRERTIKKFQAGEVQFLVANQDVAGYGLNLQCCSHQYFFSNSYRTEARLQAEDRTHRAGQDNTCIYKDILIKDSIDYHMFQKIKEGKDLNEVFKTISDIEDYF